MPKRKLNLGEGINAISSETSLRMSDDHHESKRQKSSNIFTGRPFSSQYYSILKVRQTLPVWEQKAEFLETYHKNQVLVLVGETGSGKTTQVPQFIVEDGFLKEGSTTTTTTTTTTSTTEENRTIAVVPYQTNTSQQSAPKQSKKSSEMPRVRSGSKGLAYIASRAYSKFQPNIPAAGMSYMQVANEIVAEENNQPNTTQRLEESNVKRRVYDVLNVFIAIGLVTKHKPNLRWLGLPSEADKRIESLKSIIEEKKQSIAQCHDDIDRLAKEKTIVRWLINRNKKDRFDLNEYVLKPPFFIIEAPPDPEIAIQADKDQLVFAFDGAYTFSDANDIIRKVYQNTGTKPTLRRRKKRKS
mmetsp:Transcript_5120/g.7744  ORF Transcript_5120/g.7744 Transcript_5120/m.7744 type:complete len:356 (-) Transcript_5120:31-1098(-)